MLGNNRIARYSSAVFHRAPVNRLAEVAGHYSATRREIGDGYKAAVINYGFLANAVLTTDDAVKALP
jgi:hypothetical protein